MDAKWYWCREGDGIVIRTEPEGGDSGEDYVAEIDMRYMKPAERQAAEKTAEHIVDLHNEYVKAVKVVA